MNKKNLTLPFSALQNSMSKMSKHIEEVGVLTFLRFFEKHPTIHSKHQRFSEMDIKDLRGSELFHNHTSRVMSSVKRVRNFLYSI